MSGAKLQNVTISKQLIYWLNLDQSQATRLLLFLVVLLLFCFLLLFFLLFFLVVIVVFTRFDSLPRDKFG
jgi:hypothetical protein